MCNGKLLKGVYSEEKYFDLCLIQVLSHLDNRVRGRKEKRCANEKMVSFIEMGKPI